MIHEVYKENSVLVTLCVCGGGWVGGLIWKILHKVNKVEGQWPSIFYTAKVTELYW